MLNESSNEPKSLRSPGQHTLKSNLHFGETRHSSLWEQTTRRRAEHKTGKVPVLFSADISRKRLRHSCPGGRGHKTPHGNMLQVAGKKPFPQHCWRCLLLLQEIFSSQLFPLVPLEAALEVCTSSGKPPSCFQSHTQRRRGTGIRCCLHSVHLPRRRGRCGRCYPAGHCWVEQLVHATAHACSLQAHCPLPTYQQELFGKLPFLIPVGTPKELF